MFAKSPIIARSFVPVPSDTVLFTSTVSPLTLPGLAPQPSSGYCLTPFTFSPASADEKIGDIAMPDTSPSAPCTAKTAASTFASGSACVNVTV